MARRISTQAITGTIIVIVGLLLLLSTTGIYDVGNLWRYVPSLFVLLGVWALVNSGFRNVTGPIVLIVIAGTVQLLALDLITGEAIASWWPVLIILFGLSLLFGRFRQERRVPAVSTDDVDLIGVFAGNERRITSESFRGGTATALFGGVDVDLRDAAVADPPAVLTVTALFGGAEITVPRDWTVAIDVLPVLGGVEDERRGPTAASAEDADLVVTGFVAFGGITVKD